MGASQRRKGARGEREVANLVTEALGHTYERVLTETRDGNSGDVRSSTHPLVWQVKRQKRPNRKAALREAVEAADRSRGEIPVAAVREDYGEWEVSLALSDFLKIVREGI